MNRQRRRRRGERDSTHLGVDLRTARRLVAVGLGGTDTRVGRVGLVLALLVLARRGSDLQAAGGGSANANLHFVAKLAGSSSTSQRGQGGSRLTHVVGERATVLRVERVVRALLALLVALSLGRGRVLADVAGAGVGLGVSDGRHGVGGLRASRAGESVSCACSEVGERESGGVKVRRRKDARWWWWWWWEVR